MDEPNEERMEEAYDEADLSDDEFEEESFDNLLDRVESNDPSMTNLKVLLRTPVQNDVRLGELATAIGRNTHLKAVMFDDYIVTARIDIVNARLKNLFLGVACNQSIKKFYFNRCRTYNWNVCRILTPLFKNNQVERIRIDICELNLESTRLLATSLATFDSLKEFALTHARIQPNPQEVQVSRELMQSLSGHSGLRKLDLSHTEVGMLGCSALVDLLSNPNINLRVLELASNRLGDDEAVALASGMAGNITLKEINFKCNMGIGQAGWQALFDALSSPSYRLERIKLGGNKINKAAAQSLSNVLDSNTSLKTLDLGCTSNITIAGWCVLFGALRSPNSVLEELDLSENRFTDEVMTSLTGALASNRSLKSLNLSCNNVVTGGGWQRFFSTVLANPSLGLERLHLEYCGINDAAIRDLTNNALVNNSKLKVLTLNDNDLITDAGWEMFSSILEGPHTALEELDLRGYGISDATLTLLVNSLANNKKLKKLLFYHSGDWEPPLSVLCNSDSIMSTYNSNHTLEKVGREDAGYCPEEFELLLQINQEKNPSQGARLKIINTHFNGCFITQPFVGMDLNVLPYAIAWMGRDGEVSNHFYGFIRSMTDILIRERATGGRGVNTSSLPRQQLSI